MYSFMTRFVDVGQLLHESGTSYRCTEVGWFTDVNQQILEVRNCNNNKKYLKIECVYCTEN